MNRCEKAFDLKAENALAFRIVKYSSLTYFVVGIIALALAMIAVPPTGLAYPYLDTLRQYPRDYFWQYVAILMLIVYLVLYVSLASTVKDERKAVSNIGLVFSAMSCLVLIATYYIQVSVVPISLMSGENDGLALLTQYNPHGLFIALEEIGYILMLFSIASLVWIFTGNSRAEKAIRIVSLIACIGSLLSYAVITMIFGLEKGDNFEIAIILFVWIANIVNSILIFSVFGKSLRNQS